MGERPIRVVLDPYNPVGSSAHVNFTTSKPERWRADQGRCHLNWIILDSGWEGEFCRVAEAHPRVRKVWYPLLASHPDHATARRSLRGGGGVVTFELDTDLDGAIRFTDACRIPYIAPSLGGVESLIEMPVTMSYWDVEREERLKMGITDSLIRLSCGIEDADDLVADLDQALRAI